MALSKIEKRYAHLSQTLKSEVSLSLVLKIRNFMHGNYLSLHEPLGKLTTTYILTRQLLASLATDSFAKDVKFLEINGRTSELRAKRATHE